MSVSFIADSSFGLFLELLREQGELHGPLRDDDGAVRFGPLTEGALPDLEAVRTLLPPKKYLLHPLEKILLYQSGSGYREPENVARPLILLGLHPCDLAAIAYLDMIFDGENPDPLYAAHRDALTLIGNSCTADALCSCHLTPSALNASCDLLLQQVIGGHVVSSGSHRGNELLSALKTVLEKREISVPESNLRFFGQQLKTELYTEPDADLPDWQNLADRCLGCGACSICCPTCSCFDVHEQGALDGTSAERLRKWDNCLFKSHAQLAGGMSFKLDRAQRFRYRYRHKYGGFGPLQAVPGCVGCGRCRAFCPAGLDLRPLAGQLKSGSP